MKELFLLWNCLVFIFVYINLFKGYLLFEKWFLLFVLAKGWTASTGLDSFERRLEATTSTTERNLHKRADCQHCPCRHFCTAAAAVEIRLSRPPVLPWTCILTTVSSSFGVFPTTSPSLCEIALLHLGFPFESELRKCAEISICLNK